MKSYDLTDNGVRNPTRLRRSNTSGGFYVNSVGGMFSPYWRIPGGPDFQNVYVKQRQLLRCCVCFLVSFRGVCIAFGGSGTV